MPEPRQQTAVANTLLEAVGIWAPLLVMLIFCGDPRFGDVFIDAYGSGSLAVTAAIIALTILTVTMRKFFISLLIAAFVIVMFSIQVRVLDGYLSSLKEGKDLTSPAHYDSFSDVFWHTSPEIWISFIAFIGVAAIRTKILHNQTLLFNENQ